jgi:hypothetical protein
MCLLRQTQLHAGTIFSSPHLPAPRLALPIASLALIVTVVFILAAASQHGAAPAACACRLAWPDRRCRHRSQLGDAPGASCSCTQQQLLWPVLSMVLVVVQATGVAEGKACCALAPQGSAGAGAVGTHLQGRKSNRTAMSKHVNIPAEALQETTLLHRQMHPKTVPCSVQRCPAST